MTGKLLILATVLAVLAMPAMANEESCRDASFTATSALMDLKIAQTKQLAAAYRGEQAPKSNAADVATRIDNAFRTKCKKGDPMNIPAELPGYVSKYCDLNKAVVNSGTKVVCVRK